MARTSPAKILTAILFLAFAVILQFKFGQFLGATPNFVLALLVAVAFFLGFWELLFLALAAIFVLSWQPAFSREIAAILILPLAAFYVRRFFPWRNWLNNLALIFLSVLIFYFIRDFSFLFLKDIGAFFEEAVAALIFGGIAFFVIAPEWSS